MIKVVIAEDELPLLRGLKNMIEGQNSRFKVVFSAKNGKEAVDYIEENPIDVLFTDINMPIMDGLEVLRYMSHSSLVAYSVIISGYNEFSYAQKAIQYQVKNYLLKPVDKKELKEVLHHLENELDQDSYEQKRRILADALFGTVESGDEGMFLQELYLYYFCAGPFTTDLTEELTMGNEFWGRNHLLEIADSVSSEPRKVYTFWGKSLNEMILVTEGMPEGGSKYMAQEIVNRLEGELPVTAAFCESGITVMQLKDSSAMLRKQIRDQIVFGQSTVLPTKPDQKEIILTLSQKNALQFAVRKGQYDELEQVINSLKVQMQEEGITQRNLESILKEILMLLEQTAEENQGRNCSQENDIMEMIAGSFTLDQIFEDYLTLCKDFIKNEYPTAGLELMKQVDRYIGENIEKPLTTKMLASRFGLVAPYLSHLFKEYKGESPSQYIQNIRIQSAKELLIRCSEMLVKDIAEAVGYSNPLYLSKTFKKNVGMYPSEFRLQYKKGKASLNGE